MNIRYPLYEGVYRILTFIPSAPPPYSFRSARPSCATCGGLHFSAKVNRPVRSANAGCRREWPVKIFLSGCRAYFSVQPWPLVPATFKSRKIIPAVADRPNRGKEKKQQFR